MSFKRRFILIFIVFISCVGCDRTTKSMALSMLPETEPWSYLGDTVRLQLVYNRGAFLSFGASLPEAWRRGIFTIGVGCMLLGALAYAFLSKPGAPSEVFAISLIFAGGVGNLFDRVAYDGIVVDFINIGIGPLRTGIFNIADIAITTGGLIFIAAAFRRYKENP